MNKSGLLIGLVASVLFMEFLDGTVIATALPAMARSFHTNAVDLNIGISAYLLSLGVFIPISSWMAERFGSRLIFMAAIVIFTGASALCGVAGDLLSFVLFRTLQGFGGAMMVPVGRLLVLQNTPKEKLVASMSALLWPALVAPVVGPSLGGAIATYADWRWIFFLNLPFGVLAFGAAFFVIPENDKGARRAFDWTGFLLTALGIVLFFAGTEQMSNLAGNWRGALIATGGGAATLVAAFFYMKRAPNPMLDMSYLGTPTYLISLRGGSLIRVAIGSAPFLLPLLFQLGFGWNAFRSGLIVMAVFAGNMLMKFATTPVLKRFGFRAILLWNGLFCAISLFVCSFFSPQTPVAAILVVLFLSGLARSMQFTAINTLAFADIAQPDLRSANAFFTTIFQLSLGAGVALGAIAVRLGGTLAQSLGWTAPAGDYRIAFVLVSAVGLLSLPDTLSLPRQSGDLIAGRG